MMARTDTVQPSMSSFGAVLRVCTRQQILFNEDAPVTAESVLAQSRALSVRQSI